MTDYIAGELRAQKARLDLTLDQIEERSGLKRSTIALALRGGSAIAVEVLIPLCEALGLDAASLLRSAAEDSTVVVTRPQVTPIQTTP